MHTDNRDKLIFDVNRLTAVWAFSESIFGGILHALKIPFTGLILGGFAVILITLIAISADKKSAILSSTLIVILVKSLFNPSVSFAAYFAIALQGFLGYSFFSIIKSERTAAVFLGFFTMLFSALQKLIIITVVFGNSIWESLDQFVKFILDQIGFVSIHHTVSFSLIIITIYLTIHVTSGIIIGLTTLDIPYWLKREFSLTDLELIRSIKVENYFEESNNKKKKRWWKKATGILFLTITLILLIASYISPEIEKYFGSQLLFMIIRMSVITFLWFWLIAPVLLKYLTKFIEKYKFEYASRINKTTELFPDFKKMINYCWSKSSKFKGSKRIKYFLINSLALLITVEFNNPSNMNL